MALSLSSTILIIYFSVFVLAGDAVRDIPEQVPMPNILLRNDTRLRDYVHVATIHQYWTHWHGVCFQDNQGYWSRTQGFSNYIWVTVEIDNAVSWKCTDYYQFAVDHDVIGTDFFTLGGTHGEFLHVSSEQLHYIEQHGLQVYIYHWSVTKDNTSRHDRWI